MNDKLLKQVIKDYKIPIPLIDDLYVIERLSLIDFDKKYSKAIILAEDWMKVHNTKNADDFSRAVRSAIDKIVDFTKSKEITCNSCYDDPKFVASKTHYYSALSIYNRHNANKKFISLDIIQANVQALKEMHVLSSTDDWDRLCLRACTNNDITDKPLCEYMISSKPLRQVALGHVQPKCQQKIERRLTEDALCFIVEALDIDESTVVGYTNDEIMIEYSDDTFERLLENEFADQLKKFRIDVFTLKQIGNMEFFVKERENDYPTFHNIPSTYFVQAIKKYNNLPITDDDLRFVYDGIPAKFTKSVFD